MGERERVEYNEDWIAEPILWTIYWVHLGTLTASKESVLVLIDPDEFRAKMKLNPYAFWLGRRYCEKFIGWLNEKKPEELSDIYQGEDMGEMLTSFMPLPGEALCHAATPTQPSTAASSAVLGFLSARGSRRMSQA